MTSDRLVGEYETAVLNILHGEFSFSNREEIETEIRRKLARGSFGPYDQQRGDLLRRVKDEVQRETGLRPLPEPARPEASRYYAGRHGQYGNYTDFDIPRMAADLATRYPELPEQVVAWFVRYAVSTYYLR